MCFTDKELVDALPYVRASARKLTSNRDDADDLLQDTVERALTKRHLFTSGMPIRPWLARMCHNCHIDQIRSKARRGGVAADDEDELGTLPDPEADQETKIYVVEVLQQAMLLPEHQRCIMDAHVDAGDLSYSDLSETLGVPLGTIKTRMFRARKHLEEIVG